MRRRRAISLFWAVELILALLAIALVWVLFLGNDKEYRVAVVVSDADSGGWERFIAGVKQGAREEHLRVVITGTGTIRTAEEERAILEEEIANGADAVIVQPAPGEDTAQMLEDIRAQIPVMLVRNSLSEENGVTLPYIATDGYAMGQQLGEMILEDYAGALDGKTMGIVTAPSGTPSADRVVEGYTAALEDSGVMVLWQEAALTSRSETRDLLQGEARVDILAALDAAACDVTVELSEDGALGGAVIYGIGTSEDALSALDHGDTAGLVIPNDYDMGYWAVQEMAHRLQHRFYRMENHTVESAMYRREDLFLPENTDFLFVGED